MKRRITLAIIAGIVLTAAAWTYGRSASASQKWGYLFQPDCSQASANGVGGLGWEFVGMDTTSSHRQCIFKRPKQ